MLDDGRYDAFVVWADARDETSIALELAITTGPRRGEVVDVIATRFTARDPIDLVGLPCTLVVENGAPRVEP